VTPGLKLPFEPICRPSVTSAVGARGYSLRDRRVAWTRRFAARNNRRLCVLDSTSAVKTSLKEPLHSESCVSAASKGIADASPS
jgi:hypothetical protein